MRHHLMLAGILICAVAAGDTGPQPLWAYFNPDPQQPPEAADPTPQRIPGSSRSYTFAQINDFKNTPDWFPDQHAPPPRVVLHGGEGMSFACGSCHLMSGMGHPESAPLAGLPASYFERQIAELKSGARRNPFIVNGEPQLNAPQWMINIAKDMTEEDIKTAAAWFAALKPRPWVKVVETVTLPRVYVSRDYAWTVAPGGGTEPLGARIIELPQDAQRAAARDPRVGTIAYVPVGSLKRGEALVTTGAGKTLKCASCHGADLRGVADIPGIAGGSPTYAFRQLYGFKDGSRNGALAALMKPTVAALDENDMIAIAAYTASLSGQ